MKNEKNLKFKDGERMKVKNIVSGEIFEAELRTDVSASSYGQPVLCIWQDDGTLDQVDAWAYEILEEGA